MLTKWRNSLLAFGLQLKARSALLRSCLVLSRWLRWRCVRRKPLGDEVNVLRILHFDPPIRHQLVRMPLRVGRHPTNESRALQIAHGYRESSPLFAVPFNHLLQPCYLFIHLQSEQMLDRVLPDLFFLGVLVSGRPQHARRVEFARMNALVTGSVAPCLKASAA